MSEVAEATVTEQEPITSASVEATPQVDETIAVESSGDGGTGAVEQSSIPEELASLARAYQIDPSRWSDPAALEAAVTQLDRVYYHHLDQAMQKFSAGQPGQAAQQQTQAKPGGRTKLELSKLIPNADAYDPDVLNAFKTLVEHTEAQADTYEEKLAKLEAIEAELTSYRQERAEKQQAEWSNNLDGFFSSLGKEWEDKFGSVPMNKLPPNSPQANDRNALARAIAQVQYLDQMNGVKADFKSQAERALRLEFGHELPTIERRKLALQAHQRKNGALNRPAAKTGKPGDPEELMIAKVKEWAAKVAEQG